MRSISARLRRNSLALTCAIGLVALLGAPGARSETWPTRPVRIIVPFAPGGTSDIVSRRIAQSLSERLGQNVFIENRPGGIGVIGMQLAARAEPDGYTLVANDTGVTMLPHLRKSLPYDLDRDFTPIAAYVFSPFGLVVNADSPYRSIGDLVARAKATPGVLTYGSGGIGTSPHLAAELFAFESGTKLLHVPFKGAGDALLGLMAKTIELQLVTPGTARPGLTSGKLRMLAVSGERRLKSMPEVPTFGEAGLARMSAWNWIGLWAPRGTPLPIVQRLQTEIAQIMRTPELAEFSDGLAAEPRVVVGEEFSRTLRETNALWHGVIEKIGLRPE